MIPNHSQFLEASQARKLLRISFYSTPDGGVVDRECAPLAYAPAPAGSDPANRYWVWDPAHTAGANPLGLLPGQIVSVQVLGKSFDPAELQIDTTRWNTPPTRDPATDSPAFSTTDPTLQ
jgi:hypothetical protein